MFVIRLPNGNLQVPQTAIHTGDGRIIGDVYVEIGPQDADYDRLAGILKNSGYLPSPNRYAALNPTA